MTGAIVVLLVIVGAELAIRNGLQPLRTLGGAAGGSLVLKG